MRAPASWSLSQQRPLLQQQQRLRVGGAVLSTILFACRYVKTLETSLEAAQRQKMGTDAKDAKKARLLASRGLPALCSLHRMRCLAPCQAFALGTFSSLPLLHAVGCTRAAEDSNVPVFMAVLTARSLGHNRTRKSGRRSGRRSWTSCLRRRSSSPRCPSVRPAPC